MAAALSIGLFSIAGARAAARRAGRRAVIDSLGEAELSTREAVP